MMIIEHKVLKLPMKSISLNTEKKSETELAGLKQNDPDASFVNLFAKRLLNNRPNSKKVNIEIFGTFGGRDGGDKEFTPVEVHMPWPLPNDEIYRFGLYIYQTKFSNAYT
jgi:hypothetical protein